MSPTWQAIADQLADAMARSSADAGSGLCTLTEREHEALAAYQEMRRSGRALVRSFQGFQGGLDAFVHRHVTRAKP